MDISSSVIFTDDDFYSALVSLGAPDNDNILKWACENSETAVAVLRKFVSSGADILCLPALPFKNSDTDNLQSDENYDLFCSIVAIYKEALKGTSASIAGKIIPSGLTAEPFGEIPVLDLLNIYSSQALVLAELGVDLIICDGFSSLADIRMALLGAKQANLPAVSIMSYSDEAPEFVPLSALITLHSLKVSAFGLEIFEYDDSTLDLITSLSDFSDIPFIIKISEDTPEAHSFAEKLITLGFSVIGGKLTYNKFSERALQIKNRPTLSHTEYPDFSPICAANSTDIFWISETAASTEPIVCSVDMADELVTLSDEGYDIITVKVDSFDDAYRFSLNSYIADLPVAFLSDSEEALEAALIFYCGKALIDSRSEITKEVLERLSSWYGAAIY